MARRLRLILGESVRRGLQSRDGSDCADVICPHIWPECKASASVSTFVAVAQAMKAYEDACKVGKTAPKTPVVFHKLDRRRPIAAMDLEDFFLLLENLAKIPGGLEAFGRE